jgi:hypothetical protein
MKLKFNCAGSQFCEFEQPEYELVGAKLHLVHDRENKFDEHALSIRTEADVHVGYVPKDNYKFKGHEGLFECLLFDIPVTGVITEALYKDKRFCHISQERIDKQLAKGKEVSALVKGEFVVFQVELDIDAGDASPTYHNEEGKEYLRLTKILGLYNWDPDDTGLDEWSHNTFDTYDEKMTYLNGCAVDGQIMHHKAELALYKQPLPEGAADLPKNLVDIIKKVRKVHETEVTVYDDDIDVAGTPDALVELKTDPEGFLTVLDWKRAKQCQPKFLRQVAFYAKNNGAKRAIVVLARAEEPDRYVVLDEDLIEYYYNQVANLAMFVHTLNEE